ncbi:class I SAM-dependent methyltransferase [Anatilimnocola floriformis]|uniref:class I SAM-dependent methyltransferase n=1 Tax=Anatilimnocola floriformis TaxID=2948575 RepID=UPI0020C22008|nr:class I SAM-dependent methyltransferase [Anatilimnocola floriformis]
MSITRNAKTKAFGVEEGYPTYRLRQARYYDLGLDCSRWAEEHYVTTGRKCELLDIGTYDGVTRRYCEIHPGNEHLSYHGVDIFPKGKEFVYKSADWKLHHIDLSTGLPELKTAAYDIVVCEQVLEHLHDPQLALREIERVLKPGGRMVVGVPIFLEGLHLIRKHLVPVYDRVVKTPPRGHVQAWSKRTFMRMVRQTCPHIKVETTRGFRILSGGVLRPLEYQRWWWQLNRRVGAMVPGLCTEIQMIAQKPGVVAKETLPMKRAA